MKILKMKKGENRSYLVTLYVSDYDIEALEDLAVCINEGKEKKRLNKWLLKTFTEFQKLWKRYDKGVIK